MQRCGPIILRRLSGLRVTFAPGARRAGGEAADSSALGDASRSSHHLFPPRMPTRLTSHMSC
ncbi:hypothetical protein STVIR_0160 [Streptomyces viridochromogenes Tue57]|uniref:Uncharacterized protein n=1 Tax=Streptomyces viridochromogenes Tue57 TaxID=1160705 RepID=L8PU27_STRVR|nr:hypothetical protein STVIR_0160 [Streptomyces viridochromogenes Tue57]